jgi:hypothetical protein
MSEEAETIKRLRLQGNGFVASSHVAKVIERIIKERDEARRELEELDFLRYEGGEESIGREIEKAEARGYRRGVEDAAAMLKGRAQEISDNGLSVSAVNELRGWVDVILHLRKQTGDKNSPHPENGTGHSAKPE